MSFGTKLVKIISATIIIYVAIKLYALFQPPPLPVLDEDEYWGPGAAPIKHDTSIRPFKINVSNDVLIDLKHRLEIERPYTPPLEGIQQQYGFNTNLLREIVKFWKDDYNWREREVFLNQFPQFKTNIQGLDIHYIHAKPKNVPSNVKVLPLLISHGWPGSVREFYGVIPLLTEVKENRNFVFEVIAPSLPGYGFSQASSKPGLSPSKIAVVLRNLMLRIGHEKFYVQGGDWGAAIVSDLATLFPENVLGLHSNMCTLLGWNVLLKLLIVSIHPPFFVPEESVHKAFPVCSKLALLLEESGYFHIQATKPDTIGVSLGQSPSGLAAYFLEKFSTGTNTTYKTREDGGLKGKFTYADLLDNVMLYWVTNSATTSARIYAEAVRKSALGLSRIPISTNVPSACAKFGQDVIYWPDWILKDKYPNLVYSSDYQEGGHFAALEVPELFAKDMFLAFSKMGIV